MTSTEHAWEDDIVHSLKALTGAEAASLEILLLDALIVWLVSADNPGDGYGDEHAGHLISTLFSALDSARTVHPDQEPDATEDMVAARARIVDGAHELASNGWTGVSLIVSRLMPAMLSELQDNVGDRGKQARGVFVYLLYGVAVGTRDEQDPAVMAGLTAAFAAWNGLLGGGYVVPWRRPPA